MTTRNAQRDEQILGHLGLYRVSFRAVISFMFFQGGFPGNVLQRLRAEGRVTSRGGLRNRLRYYQLSVTEASARGLPVARGRPPKPQAFSLHVATLWYCSVAPGGSLRRRLDTPELVHLFGVNTPKGAHVLDSNGPPKVVRVIAVAPHTPARSIARALRKRILRLDAHPELGMWVRDKRYAFAIITSSEAKRARLAYLVQRYGKSSRAEIRVECAPQCWTSRPPGSPACRRSGRG